MRNDGKNSVRLCDKNGMPTVAFAGNPNVGKSSVFNHLTGLHQHTGNWSGKTVGNTVAKADINGCKMLLADLPGTYSIEPESFEEETARDFLLFCKPELTVYICGALSLERNLIMLMQISEICDNIILCINMTDELKKTRRNIDAEFLEKALGIRVILLSAKRKRGFEQLKNAICSAVNKPEKPPRTLYYDSETEELISKLCSDVNMPDIGISRRAIAIRMLCRDKSFIKALKEVYPIYDKELTELSEKAASSVLKSGDDIREKISSQLADRAGSLIRETIINSNNCKCSSCSYKTSADKILTGKFFAYPIMLLLLVFIFWITVSAANIPSEILNNLFSEFEPHLLSFLSFINCPLQISEMLVFGIYRVVTWIIAVMLPPMAIFFPLFTLLEDSGYLPRIAFNLDRAFCSCGACGKQALTMCMGFGCNAVGVSGCRIIGSERERLIAIITNTFSPCNGRFPILIAIIAMFAINSSGMIQSLILTALIAFSVCMSLVISKLLSVTILKGKPSSFILELPPYRMPQIGSVILRSLIDRTLFVLLRAVTVAAPCGLVIWLLANISSGPQNASVLSQICSFLDPAAKLFGMDGVILFAFVLGLPANEIVIPIIMMSYLATGNLTEYESIAQLKELFVNNGWTIKTAVCTCVFTMMHWPCATTLMTVARETKSLKITALSFIVPAVSGFTVCFILNIVFSLLGF